MSTNEAHLLGVRNEVDVKVEKLGRESAPRPGAILNVRVTMPQPPTQAVRNALRAAVHDALDRVERVWRADIVFQVGDKPTVHLDLAAPATERQSDRPILELQAPGPGEAPLISRHELEQGVTYALMRAAVTPGPLPHGVVPLEVATPKIPGTPQVLFRFNGTEVRARIPEGGSEVTVVLDIVTKQLGGSWAPLPADPETGAPSGTLFLMVHGAPVLVHFRVLPPGTRATRFRGLLSGDVEVSRRKHADATGHERFQKTYECVTAEDAALLADHFSRQQRLVRAVNAAVRAANTEKGVARNGLEETIVQRGTTPRYDMTEVLQRVAPNTSAETITEPGDPRVQADHRVFVRTPLLRSFSWETGRVSRLAEFLPMARALDELHRLGAAHGDVKPQNTCFAQAMPANSQISIRWAVLVDTEGLAQPNADLPSTGLHTPRFTHPAFRASHEWPPTIDHLIANDRTGFAAVVVAAVLGSSVDPTGPDGPAERRGRLTAALNQSWSREATDRVVTLLETPFEQESARLAAGTDAWSCAGWVEQLLEATAAAEVERPVGQAPPANDEGGRAMAELRRVYAREAGPTRRAAIEASLADTAYALARRTFQRWFWAGFALVLVFVAVAVVILFPGGPK